ncbi:MAG: ABC transporter ATP-binding protein [Treponema sp.]|nr:ABC transporter ATP-binding protein [Treponema sp.]
MKLLEINNLSVTVKKIYTAVDGIDITIDTGEIAALAGESGSGKTLSALSIMGLLPPAANTGSGSMLYKTAAGETMDLCTLDEKSMRRIRGKEIAMVFQEPRQSLNPLMRTGKQISEALELHGTDSKSAKDAALDLLHRLQFPQPEKIFTAWPHQLSGGMCQRVMIAIAAICRPRLLVADEPSSALDNATLGHCLALLAQINREFGTAILFITHDLSMAARFCSRMMVMYAGKIIEEGPAAEIFSAPRHPCTRALAGAIPGTEKKGRPLLTIPGIAPSPGNRPSGCAFAPRCPKAGADCRKEVPPFTNYEDGRRSRCFYTEAHNG